MNNKPTSYVDILGYGIKKSLSKKAQSILFEDNDDEKDKRVEEAIKSFHAPNK